MTRLVLVLVLGREPSPSCVRGYRQSKQNFTVADSAAGFVMIRITLRWRSQVGANGEESLCDVIGGFLKCLGKHEEARGCILEVDVKVNAYDRGIYLGGRRERFERVPGKEGVQPAKCGDQEICCHEPIGVTLLEWVRMWPIADDWISDVKVPEICSAQSGLAGPGTRLQAAYKHVIDQPLPDERPRQSVANLIGRFEQQNKRQSAAAAANPPRASSVASQHTGDSATAALRESREWPPKPRIVATNVFESKAPETSKSPSPPAPAAPASPPTVPPVQPAQEEEKPVSPITPANSDKHIPPTSPSPPKKIASPSKSTAPRPSTTTVRTPATPSKNREGRPSTVGAKTTTRTPVKSPPPTSFHTARSTPAIASKATPPAAKPTPSRSRPTSRASGPITPARAKTPSGARPKTPSVAAVSRPKTPSSTSRPKLPSSGLYAPTAASLARARNSDAGPPLPVRKPTATKETLDRLSKPTAASLSKARQPTMSTTTSTPPRGTPATRGAASAARGAAVTKARPTPTPAKAKDSKAKIAGAAAVGATAATVAGVAAASDDSEHISQDSVSQEVFHDEPEHHEYEESGSTLVDEPEHAESHEPEEVREEVPVAEEHHVEETPAEEVPAEVPQAEEPIIQEPHEETAIEEPEHHDGGFDEAPARLAEDHVEQPDVVQEDSHHTEAEDTIPEAHSTQDIPAATPESEPEGAPSEPETHVDTESDTVSGSVVADKAGGEIVELVSMLEAPTRPLSIVLPDEAEIPDIED
ncbi:hypothetical protein C8Q78DRAFT_991392 [Trametes maxima]|nr:hypothetical protein C8Q78DRAFT_991392 [Trametes maxima]